MEDISCRRFTAIVLEWAEDHPRPLPWKETNDPYHIWISEIILQQTQVAQGLPFYQAFVRRFPSIQDLAAAHEDDVLRIWQGLGYNSRARNMHVAARTIVLEYNGSFPGSYDEIRALKGVGDYTAAAISSFAFGLPTPVLDSNVIRVLSRVKGIVGDPAKKEVREIFYALLHRMIKTADPAVFNQSLMNFGAMQCTARNPDCQLCVLKTNCVAYHEGIVDRLPVRKKPAARRKRFFHYFLLHGTEGVVVHKRLAKDIWQQMYEFPMMETKSVRMPPHHSRVKFLGDFGVTTDSTFIRHHALAQTLTHQVIHCVFYEVHVRGISRRKLPPNYRFEFLKNLKYFAFPKVIRTFLTDNSLHLTKLLKKSKT